MLVSKGVQGIGAGVSYINPGSTVLGPRWPAGDTNCPGDHWPLPLLLWSKHPMCVCVCVFFFLCACFVYRTFQEEHTHNIHDYNNQNIKSSMSFGTLFINPQASQPLLTVGGY